MYLPFMASVLASDRGVSPSTVSRSSQGLLEEEWDRYSFCFNAQVTAIFAIFTRAIPNKAIISEFWKTVGLLEYV